MLYDLLEIVFTATISFLVLFIIAKILGKKQVGELDFIDYVVGISIGSIAAEMATNTADKPFYEYLIGMFIFFILTLFIDILATKGNFFKKLFKGVPIIIINNGEMNYEGLKKCRLDVNDVAALIREKGYFDFDDIEFAIFETNGSISVLPKASKSQVVSEDLKIKKPTPSLPQNIIVDGNVSKFSLSYLKKDKDWLFERLNIKSKKELKKIFLAVYKEDEDSFSIYYKN